MSQDSVPVDLVQGTTAEWEVTNSDYPASAGYELTYVFKSSRQSVTVTGANSSGTWTVTLTKAITADMLAGGFGWQAFLTHTSGSPRYTIASGFINILPDYAATQIPPLDPRSYARRRLEALNELLIDVPFLRTLSPEQIEGIERVRKQSEWDVKRENDAEKLRAGGYPTRKILTRFQ